MADRHAFWAENSNEFSGLNRKRNKGRDFYDIVYLLGLGQVPDYTYLKLKTGIDDPEKLRSRMINKCYEIDMQAVARDISPFLFDKKDTNKILLFPEYMKQVPLG